MHERRLAVAAREDLGDGTQLRVRPEQQIHPRAVHFTAARDAIHALERVARALGPPPGNRVVEQVDEKSFVNFPAAS